MQKASIVILNYYIIFYIRKNCNLNTDRIWSLQRRLYWALPPAPKTTRKWTRTRSLSPGSAGAAHRGRAFGRPCRHHHQDERRRHRQEVPPDWCLAEEVEPVAEPDNLKKDGTRRRWKVPCPPCGWPWQRLPPIYSDYRQSHRQWWAAADRWDPRGLWRPRPSYPHKSALKP